VNVLDMVWDKLAAYVTRADPLSEVVADVITDCERLRPHRDWAQLRELDWNDGSAAVCAWWQQLLERERPPASVRGLWFGLCEPVENGRARYDLYAAGTRDYKPDDLELEWVFSQCYHPQGHPHPVCLAETYRIARKPEGLGNDAEWTLGLVFGCGAVARALNSPQGRTGLNATPPLGVAAGWDGGDFIFLGELHPDRFETHPRVI
jgi:hypothetical protein